MLETTLTENNTRDTDAARNLEENPASETRKPNPQIPNPKSHQRPAAVPPNAQLVDALSRPTPNAAAARMSVILKTHPLPHALSGLLVRLDGWNRGAEKGTGTYELGRTWDMGGVIGLCPISRQGSCVSEPRTWSQLARLFTLLPYDCEALCGPRYSQQRYPYDELTWQNGHHVPQHKPARWHHPPPAPHHTREKHAM